MNLRSLINAHKALILQFCRYLFSGSMAAIIDLGTYEILLHFGIDKFIASPIGNFLGFVSAFFLHKFIVYTEHRMSGKQFFRYVLANIWNTLAQLAVIWLVVDHLGYSKTLGKILGIGLTVSWNFFLYKFLVYV